MVGCMRHALTGTPRSPGRTLDTSHRVELRLRRPLRVIVATILRDVEIRFRQFATTRIGEQACAVNVRVKYFVRLRTPEIKGLKSTRGNALLVAS
jgi:hypothetical protein